MHAALEALGLGPDADARAIKRAYATKLKQARPDTDPEAFQRLNEAYRAALEWIETDRRRTDRIETARIETARIETAQIETARIATTGDDGEDDEARARALAAREPAPGRESNHERAPDDAGFADPPTDVARDDVAAPPPAHPRPPPLPRIAPVPQTLLDACLTRARTDRADALRAWLLAEPHFWSIEAKARFGSRLWSQLERERPPLPCESFDALVDFFGLADVAAQASHAFGSIEDLRRELHLAWRLRDPDERADGTATMPAADAALVRQLRRPLRAWPRLAAMLLPGRPGAILRYLRRSGYRGPWELPPGIDPAQVAFWEDAADPARMSPARTAVGLARASLAGALVGVLVALTLALLPATATRGLDAWFPAFALPGAWAAWAGVAILRCHIVWLPQTARPRASRDWPALLPPMLVAAAFVAKYGLDAEPAAVLFNLVALVALTWRWLRIAAPDLSFEPTVVNLLLFIPTVKVLLALVAIMVIMIEVGAAVVLAAWAFELWSAYGRSRRR